MGAREKQVIKILQRLYPKPRPSLHFKNPFESLVATVLSAQCTDERVNKVTPALFKAAPTPQKLLALGEKKLISFVKSTGFYRAKSKNIIGACRMLVEKYRGRVPNTREELQRLPGVGRKTASVILAQAFGIPAFPVDRHVLRVANRLGLIRTENADKASEELEKNIPEKLWIPLHMQLVAHGRKICRPNPKCGVCKLLKLCPEGRKRIKTENVRRVMGQYL